MNHFQVHQPDDKGFKSLLEGRKAFHELLRHFIPDTWTLFSDAMAVASIHDGNMAQRDEGHA